MIKAPRNTMATAPRWRTEAIAPHTHSWVTVGTDDRGEVYSECSVCDARSCAGIRDKALKQDWLEYRADWDEAENVAAPEPAAAPSPPDEEEFDGGPVKRGPGRPRKY